MNQKVDAYLAEAKKWRSEMAALRTIVLDCGLAEDFKWRQPCYTVEGGIVLLIGAFKDYCALAFFKGALLPDPSGILVSPGVNSQSMRQLRFTGVEEIAGMELVVKSCIEDAMAVEKAGLKVQKNPKVAIPEELENRFDKNPALKAAFQALTPGRQRAYLMHFAQPKQSQTRAARIEKCTPLILDGKGLGDDYRSIRK